MRNHLEEPMATKNLARLMPRIGRVMAVAAAAAVVGGAVTLGAHDRKNDEQHDKDHDKGKDKDKDHNKHHKGWHKVDICHADRDGRFRLIEITSDAEAAHRAHGDGQPGDRVPKRFRHRWNRDCKEVPEPPEAPPTKEPEPPADPQLACPCWNTYKRSELLAVLDPQSSPAESYCVSNSSTVSLSQDLGVNTLVFAGGFCSLRVGGVDVSQNFALSPLDANVCRIEAAALVPSITWCPQQP